MYNILNTSLLELRSRYVHTYYYYYYYYLLQLPRPRYQYQYYIAMYIEVHICTYVCSCILHDTQIDRQTVIILLLRSEVASTNFHVQYQYPQKSLPFTLSGGLEGADTYSFLHSNNITGSHCVKDHRHCNGTIEIGIIISRRFHRPHK